MDKRQFFDQLSKQLATKYNLLSRQISCIRSFALGDKKSRKEIAEWGALKLSQPRRNVKQSHVGRRDRGKNYYQTFLNFVASCSEEAWNDVVQKTEFDK